jgi:hypothetical protein
MARLKDSAEENIQVILGSIAAVITMSSSINGRQGIDKLFVYSQSSSSDRHLSLMADFAHPMSMCRDQ